MILTSPLPSEHERKAARMHFASRAISWCKVSRPGAETVYHRGLLLVDRLDNPALDVEAQIYYLAAQEGYAELMQMRLGPDYAYIAHRTNKRMTDAREELFRIKVIEGATDAQETNRPRIARPTRLRSVLGRFLPAGPALAFKREAGHVEEAPSGAGDLGG